MVLPTTNKGNIMVYNVAGAVLKGAAVLDDNYEGDWRSQIDRRTLFLNCTHYCVLGQLYGSWQRGLDVLLDTDGADNDGCSPDDQAWAEENGFEGDYSESGDPTNRNYEELTSAWLRYLTYGEV